MDTYKFDKNLCQLIPEDPCWICTVEIKIQGDYGKVIETSKKGQFY